MGSIYTVIPLSAVDREGLNWFNDTFGQNIEFLEKGDSRYPDIEELYRLVNSLNNYKIAINETQDHITIGFESINDKNMSTQLVCSLIEKHFYFSKGSETLIVEVMRIIAKKYGPFMIVSDSMDFGMVL